MLGALCDAILFCTARAGFGHAFVTWATRDHPPTLVHTSSQEAVALSDLQDALGEGPTITSLATGASVFVGDMRLDPPGADWLLFGGEAAALGVRSVTATPLRVHEVGVGALTLHGTGPAPEPPGGREFSALLSALGVVLLGSWHLLDPEGRGDRFTPHSAVVHQAAGMVSVQAATTLADAMLRLQAHALGRGLTLTAVCQLVVDRALRFEVRDDDLG